LAHRCLAQTNLISLLPQIKVPTMVVAGKHDTVRPHAGTEELAKKIPGARFELIEEAGHFLPTTGPKTLVKLLKDFLPKS
jgi:proline iminopeptidase